MVWIGKIMKKIAVVTSTRAEYGLLMPVIKKLREYESEQLKIDLIVTGTHLSKEYGYTIDEIINTGVRIDTKIKVPVGSKDVVDISDNQAAILKKFTRCFISNSYEAVVILGDRYEMLSIAVAAGNTHTPIMHLCGGDTTEGAIDEWIRHSITKMSYLHFTTNDVSYRRVLQLGESPDRVFNFGSTSIDNILGIKKMSKREVLSDIGLSDCDYALCTYHPVTMENDIDYSIEEFVKAIQCFTNIQFVITKSNADQGGSHINELLDEAKKQNENIHVYSSLGVIRYLSLMQSALFVLGNSSSGIIETPSFGIPTVNIGDRQRGRLQADSIINCNSDAESIVKAIKKAIEGDFLNKCKDVVSPYGDGNASEKIAQKIVEVVNSGQIDLKKKFYDNEIMKGY